MREKSIFLSGLANFGKCDSIQKVNKAPSFCAPFGGTKPPISLNIKVHSVFSFKYFLLISTPCIKVTLVFLLIRSSIFLNEHEKHPTNLKLNLKFR